MTQLYSPSEKGFYDTRVHTKIPEDAIQLTEKQYHDLLEGQSKGFSIQATSKGLVELVAQAEREIPLEDVLEQLDADLKTYIEKTHEYTPFVLSIFQAMSVDTSLTANTREQSQSVSKWIYNIVLPFYYKTQAEIKQAQKPSTVVWDFAVQCDAKAPKINIADLLSKKIGKEPVEL